MLFRSVPSDKQLDEQAANAPPPQPTPDAQLKAQVDKYKVDQNQTTELAKTGLIHPQAAMQMMQANRNDVNPSNQNESANPGMPGAQQAAG